MSDLEQSDSAAWADAAPTPTFAHFLSAVCSDERIKNTRGDALVEVAIGVWTIRLPLSEVYGALEKIGLRS
jgi:hypothetical protein